MFIPSEPVQLFLVDYSLLENTEHIVKPEAEADSAILPVQAAAVQFRPLLFTEQEVGFKIPLPKILLL